MKQGITLPFKTIMMFFLSIAAISCQKKPVDINIKNKSYHFDEMGKKLESKLGSGCVGMQYSITENGQLRTENAIGLRVLPIDGLELPYTTTTRKSVHSCSKTITAVALVAQMNKYNVKLDDAIGDFLPERWNLNPSMSSITFRNLLTHRSGLTGTRDDFASMKEYMTSSGIFLPTANAVYANVNYSLLRLIIPMINPSIKNDINNNYTDTYADQTLSNAYVNIVRELVLIPSGINAAVAPAIWDGSATLGPTRNYNFSDQSVSGYTHTDQTLLTGAGGWYMNTNEYAAFLAHLFGNKIPNVDATMLMNNRLGMWNGNWNETNFFDHNGSITSTLGRGGVCQWIHIPTSNITMVVQINSQNNNFSASQLKTMMIETINESYY